MIVKNESNFTSVPKRYLLGPASVIKLGQTVIGIWGQH